MVGASLFFSGLELALAARAERFTGAEVFAVLLIAAVGLAANPTVGFVTGLCLAALLRRGWWRLPA